MAEINWDKKVGKFERINSDYLTPEPHAHNIKIGLDIEVYSISYDWGLEGVIKGNNNSHVEEFSEPYYRGNITGKVVSASFALDSTSDMRTSGSFTIVVDKDSPFVPNADNGDFWKRAWLKITKKYYYINDIDMYPMYNWGNYTGLWNNNGVIASDPSHSILGWFVPNSNSFSYNVETRELSNKESIDTSTPTGKLMLTFLAGIAEFERENMLERQREGIAIAKRNGVYKGRKPFSSDKFDELYCKYIHRELNKTELAHQLGISRPTLDKLIKEHEKTRK